MILKKNVFYRTVSAECKDTVLESGPSFNGGGRFNPAKKFGALYFCEDERISYLEWLKGRNADEVEPHVTLAFKISISKVVAIDQDQGFPLINWKMGGFSKPQKIGERAYFDDREGILYWSARASGKVKNLVLFPADLLKTSQIVPIR